MLVVAKAFTTVNRRFVEGTTIAAGEDLSPRSLPDLLAAGFVVDPDAGPAAELKPADKPPVVRSLVRK